MAQDDLARRLQYYQPKPLNMVAEYAVFVPLVQVAGVPSFLFQVRSKNLRRQPGEICFPGGKMEPGETPTGAALRELQEELGVSQATALGQLDFLVTRHRTVIYPVLGEFSTQNYIFSENEVEDVFYVPVKTLAQPEEFQKILLSVEPQFPDGTLPRPSHPGWRQGEDIFPVYRIPGEKTHVIWGITGRIAHQAACFVLDIPHKWE